MRRHVRINIVKVEFGGGILMKINVYGESKLPKILILHPMEITGAELYHIFSPYLEAKYCIVAPDQGAHGDSGAYLSQEAEFGMLTDYLTEHHLTDFQAIYAASMGCTLGVELIGDKRFSFNHIWFDGACFSENASFMNFIMRSMFLRKAKQMRKNPTLPPSNLLQMYGPELGELMKKNFVRFSDDDIKRICYSCTHYHLRQVPTEIQKKCILSGESMIPTKRCLRKGWHSFIRKQR